LQHYDVKSKALNIKKTPKRNTISSWLDWMGKYFSCLSMGMPTRLIGTSDTQAFICRGFSN